MKKILIENIRKHREQTFVFCNYIQLGSIKHQKHKVSPTGTYVYKASENVPYKNADITVD